MKSLTYGLFAMLLLATVEGYTQPGIAWKKIEPWLAPPSQYTNEFGSYRDPLTFYNGNRVRTRQDWMKRRNEIKERWHRVMGPWPQLIAHPGCKVVDSVRRGKIMQYTVEIAWRSDEITVGYLLIPSTAGKKPAVLNVFYEPESGIGATRPYIDYSWQLANRGFVTLSVGINYINKTKPYGQYYPEFSAPQLQPLSMLAYLAANCASLLAGHLQVDSTRIGIIGFSYGSKWAMFASCLHERFAAAVWIDGGIVFDERRPNVNYWEPWYLGNKSPVNGHAYTMLKQQQMDLVELHSLMAPRPFLVSGGSEDSLDRWIALNHTIRVNKFLGVENRVAMHNRKEHLPDQKANEVIYAFFEHFLQSKK